MFIIPRTDEQKTPGDEGPGRGERGEDEAPEPKGPPLPKSPTASWINLLGLFCCICAVWWIRDHGQSLSSVLSTSIVLGALALPILILELLILRTYRNPSTGIDFDRPADKNLPRAVIKYLGFVATIGLVLCVYWVFPEYQGTFFDPYYTMIRVGIPPLLIVALPYFLIIDRYMAEPRDGYWHVGQLLFCRWRAVDWNILWQHTLGWVVKLFFLPLMFLWLADNVETLRFNDLSEVWDSFSGSYDFLILVLYSVDLVFGCVGYLLTIRLFDTHIRSTEPSVLGWVVAIGCYSPFSELIFGNYLVYQDGREWWGWWADNPMMYKAWGTMILFLVFVYTWATFQFGLRFSNLTHRGILTNGPYRFTKHPAYVCKNLSWWLISMPFLSTAGWTEALRQVLLLLGVNLIYLLRARTEERHLSSDPDYVQYGKAMDERSIFSWLGRLIPIFRYRTGRLFNKTD